MDGRAAGRSRAAGTLARSGSMRAAGLRRAPAAVLEFPSASARAGLVATDLWRFTADRELDLHFVLGRGLRLGCGGGAGDAAFIGRGEELRQVREELLE